MHPGPRPPAEGADAADGELSPAVRAAVAAASEVLARAAEDSRVRHLTADRDAAELVADQAGQDAAASRYRADAEASRVSRAAAAAVVSARQWQDDPPSRRDRLRAAEVAITVKATAASLDQRTRALARSVAKAVTERAHQVDLTRSSLHRAIVTEAAATSAAMEAQARAAAARAQDDGQGPALEP